MNDDKQEVQTGIRLSKLFIARLDKIADQMSQDTGVRLTRAQVLRLAAEKGVEQLESKRKKR